MKIAVIGAGASGITAAIYAKRVNPSNSVTVIERSDRILKKILSTGNGRCNLSNAVIAEDNYYSQSPEAITKILTAFTPCEERQFFEELGIMFCEESSRIYPYSKKASAVCDALRFEVERLGIKVILNTRVKEIKKASQGFIINNLKYDRVIISAGGSAAPVFGTDGNSFNLLKSLGHRITPVFPALVPIKTKENTASLKGIRANCTVTLIKNGISVKKEEGELQLTQYGLSGIAIMQLSRLTQKGDIIEIDLIPHLSEDEVTKHLFTRAVLLKERRIEDFLTGILHKPLAMYIYKELSIPLDLKAESLTKKDIINLSKKLKALRFTAVSTLSWEDAQVTAGGALLDEFDLSTLESKICPDLYCTGEALDCVGDCGGYNLHWAWATGAISGKAAGKGEN